MKKMLMGMVLGCLVTATTATAQDAGWSFKVTPYFWAIGLNGTTQIGELPPVSVDASFSDIWENLDVGLAIFGVARREQWMLVADVSYLDLTTSDTVSDVRVDADITSTIASVGAGYQTFADDRMSVDVFGGARYWRAKNEVAATGLGSASRTEDWISPLVGVNLNGQMGEKMLWFLIADVGGFGAGSDLEYQVFPGIGYQFSDLISAYASYRWLDVDYEKSDYLYDLRMEGWLAGVGFSF